ncbi:MAG: hypothetical protein RBS40_04950 [Rhodocyclaceae bacterium]|nr:hypothetical protein [Rhodocyclaceae bacterium]
MTDRKLVRELALVVAIKLMLLTVLWWVFIRDERVTVDAETMRAHAVTASVRAMPPTSGDGRHDQ